VLIRYVRILFRENGTDPDLLSSVTELLQFDEIFMTDTTQPEKGKNMSQCEASAGVWPERSSRSVLSFADVLLQFAKLMQDPVYRGSKEPIGQGEPVLLIPGFLAGDWTLRLMAGWLNRAGYRAYLSGIDWNVDCPNRTVERLRWRMDHILNETQAPVILIGHSLGGVLARFLGMTFPEKIHHIIALGSPICPPLQVHPLLLVASRLLQPVRRARGDVEPQCGRLQCPCRFSHVLSSSPPDRVGCTAIFSKQDGAVDWRCCLAPEGENREVTGEHMSLIVNPQVYHIIAETLTRRCQEVRNSSGAQKALTHPTPSDSSYEEESKDLV
jgi:Alpha/beta hydrolase family